MLNYIGDSCAITGHRPNKIGGESLYSSPLTQYITEELERKFIFLINKGINIFYVGGALGVDTISAITLLKLKKTYNIKINLCIPFKEFTNGWAERHIITFNKIKKSVDSVVYVDDIIKSNDMYTKYKNRNIYMVNKSSYLISVWDSSFGGTMHCTNYAKSLNRKILRINPKAHTFGF